MLTILQKETNIFLTLLICILMVNYSPISCEILDSQSASDLDFDNLSNNTDYLVFGGIGMVIVGIILIRVIKNRRMNRGL